jgi:hypothetical protein
LPAGLSGLFGVVSTRSPEQDPVMDLTLPIAAAA